MLQSMYNTHLTTQLSTSCPNAVIFNHDTFSVYLLFHVDIVIIDTKCTLVYILIICVSSYTFQSLLGLKTLPFSRADILMVIPGSYRFTGKIQ